MSVRGAKPKPEPGSAIARIDEAYSRFKDTTSLSDARRFQDTRLKDVWDAAKEVEKELGAKSSYRGLRRLNPLLTGLGHYSDALGILCNGTPYLPWIWAPIKLFLQVASDYLSAFEKLMNAFSEIADALPRFDRLANALKDKSDFPAVLSVFYCDILEFHRRAYKFFRANSWKQFFDSSWGRFDIRFKGVIADLKYHADLVDKEANAHSIASTEEWRQRQLEEIQKSDARRADEQFHAVLNWLDILDYAHEDHIDDIVNRTHGGTTEWLLCHAKLKAWISAGGQAWLWLNGKPGAGKSVLCAQLIRSLQSSQSSATAYFMCDFRAPQTNNCSSILRIFIRQLIKQDHSLVPFVYDDYVLKGVSPSRENLKQLLLVLVAGVGSSRIILDGVDECAVEEQNQLFSALRLIIDKSSAPTECKVAIFSRDITHIQKRLEKYPAISLTAERTALNSSIKAFVHHEINALRPGLEESYVGERIYTEIERKIVAKADGMFLWVRLVLETLRDTNSGYEMERAVDDLPRGLDEAYGRIIRLLQEDRPRGTFQKAAIAFSLIAYAERPLKAYEILSGVNLCTVPLHIARGERLARAELDKLKPLVEVDSSDHVSFVHFTVKEFLLDQLSGPFLAPMSALTNITLACVCCLHLSLDLVDPKVSDRERINSVALGHHGLHLYANTYWLRHLGKLSQSCKEASIPPEVDLVRQLRAMCDRNDQIRAHPAAPFHEALTLRSTYHNHFEAFNHPPYIRDFALQALDYERCATREFTSTENQERIAKPDPTMLTEASKGYDRLVAKLLSPSASVGLQYLSRELVSDFKSWYGQGAFPCRFRTCLQHSKGFFTEKERNIHEQVHAPHLFCSEASCPYATSIGFRTANLLKKHTKNYHSPTSIPIPRFRAQPMTIDYGEDTQLSRRRARADKMRAVNNQRLPTPIISKELYDDTSSQPKSGHDVLKTLFEAAAEQNFPPAQRQSAGLDTSTDVDNDDLDFDFPGVWDIFHPNESPALAGGAIPYPTQNYYQPFSLHESEALLAQQQAQQQTQPSNQQSSRGPYDGPSQYSDRTPYWNTPPSPDLTEQFAAMQNALNRSNAYPEPPPSPQGFIGR